MALQFGTAAGGVNKWISIGGVDVGQPFSVHCWGKLNVASSPFQGHLMSKWNSPGGGSWLLMWDNTLDFLVYDSSASLSIAISSGTMSQDVWASCGGVSTGSATIVYLNGVANSAGGGGVKSSGVDIRFGTNSVDSGAGFRGDAGEFAIWSAALSAAEMGALAAGTPANLVRPADLWCYIPAWGLATTEPDLSGNGRNGTVAGSPPAENPPPVGSPFPFDGYELSSSAVGPRFYTIINGTQAQLINVNAGGTDVSPMTYKASVLLTEIELAVLASTQGVMVVSDLSPSQMRLIPKNIVRFPSA